MNPAMQNSESGIQTPSQRALTWRTVILVCILPFAFCVSEVAAQQQPGMPGSMGFTGGIVASNVPPKIQDGISSALKVVPFTVGKDFDVVLISFDHRDTPEAANAKKRAHLQYWSVPETADGWHFLTGAEPEIQRVTSAAGFTYQWDAESQQFAHVSGVLVTTPDGRLSRYFYGVEFSPKDLRLALVDSGQGRLGSVVEELLLYCFHYDPSSGKYGAAFMNMIRLGGVLTVGLIVGFIVLMRWRELRHVAERHA